MSISEGTVPPDAGSQPAPASPSILGTRLRAGRAIFQRMEKGPVSSAGSPQRTTRRSHRWLIAAGLTLIFAAVATGAWLAWTLLGTNVVAHQRAQSILGETHEAWAHGERGPATAILKIPRFGDSWEVPVVEGTDSDALSRGIGWDPDSAKPGEIGNFVIAGHRATHGQPFRDFPELRAGDLVQVELQAATYTYRLRGSGTDIRVPFTEPWPLWPVPAPGAETRQPKRAVITLVTCAEIFHTEDRNVVIGDLIEATEG
jgi:sortase A